MISSVVVLERHEKSQHVWKDNWCKCEVVIKHIEYAIRNDSFMQKTTYCGRCNGRIESHPVMDLDESLLVGKRDIVKLFDLNKKLCE